MALGVVLLDVRELSCAAERLVIPVEVAQPPERDVSICNLCTLNVVLLVEVGIAAADVTEVALEVLNVYGVEADDCCEEANILLCDAVAEVEGTAGSGEICFRPVKGLEELRDGFLICLLSAAGVLVSIWNGRALYDIRSKAGFVDTVVDVVVSPLVSLLDLRLQILRKQNHVLVLVVQQVVELSVKHANDLTRLVADNGVLLGVVEGRDRESALVVLVHVKVDITQMSKALVNRIGLDVLAGLVVLGSGESPSLLEHLPVD